MPSWMQAYILAIIFVLLLHTTGLSPKFDMLCMLPFAERIFADGLLPSLRLKLSNLSELMREIKVNFARFYNRRYHRRGYFLGRPL